MASEGREADKVVCEAFCDSNKKKKKKKDDNDMFRSSKLRYLGYANEFGESFRNFIGPKAVGFSYLLSSAYVIADTGAKASDTWKAHGNKPGRGKQAFKTGLDVLTWQSLASVIIPGFTINRIVALTRAIACKTSFGGQGRLISSAAGLAAIPYIIKPIDEFVDIVMDDYVRPALAKI
ncbi:mitochondrial fission process protein 1-like [Cimex lectularius]|uniref:Mitochondrial fission process protein 1 n=1 Tax=Cimex lectularius TaxID=79782 RepID=A0A8I6TEW0_CIMLE|nr:mitochondrial fission process protein 1-like [Cimex lectularius]XP_014250768.1 mitochondrial fission process protein 1-like [Cimex lectularius]